jgi:hypothetical protein
MRDRQREFALLSGFAHAAVFNRRYIYDNALIVTTKYAGESKNGPTKRFREGLSELTNRVRERLTNTVFIRFFG